MNTSRFEGLPRTLILLENQEVGLSEQSETAERNVAHFPEAVRCHYELAMASLCEALLQGFFLSFCR